MFTDGDLNAPTLSKVIVFPYGEFVDTTQESEMIRNEARVYGRTSQSTEVLEGLYGPGFVTEYNTPSHRSNGWKSGQRKGTNGGELTDDIEKVKKEADALKRENANLKAKIAAVKDALA